MVVGRGSGSTCCGGDLGTLWWWVGTLVGGDYGYTRGRGSQDTMVVVWGHCSGGGVSGDGVLGMGHYGGSLGTVWS